MTDSLDITSLGATETDLSNEQVDSLLTTLGKALRAFNMYQENNPVFQRFQQTLHEEFAALWEETGSLDLIVQEDGFRYGDHVFNVGKGRDSLPFLFYKDGIRNLTFLPGFEDEAAAFMKAVNRALKQEADEDDIITVLWEEDFASLQYGYVDLLSEGLSIPDAPRKDPEPIAGLSFQTEVAEAESEATAETTAGQTGALKQGLSREDFDETLYFLDQGEMAALQEQVEIEMERDLKRDVLNALFDRLEEPQWPDRQAEILDILDQLLPLFLSRGDLDYAGRVLEELDRMIGEGGVLDGALEERVERLFSRLSDANVLEQFVQALEDGAVDPRSDDVNLFFSRLRPEAMPVLIRFAEMTENAAVRARIASAIDGLASRHPGVVNELLKSDEPFVVMGAARVAGRVGLGQAVPGLKAALSHGDRDVRMAVVEALVSIRLTPALTALIDALDDPDREVRIAAAKALGAVRFASARDRFAAIVDDNRLKDADLTEKMAFFEAYGGLGGSGAVERFEKILHHKGMLGRRFPSETRACAALGLGQAGTPEAKKALVRARDEEDPVVRNAVLRALKQEVPAE